MKLRIGLDLDNTLIKYDHIFSEEARIQGLVANGWTGSKKDLKNALICRSNGVAIWQALQGKVYGRCIDRAHLFPGAAFFLMSCRQRGYEVFIISHKTEYGHFDETNTPLRIVAMSWMTSHGFFQDDRFALPQDHVFFEGTRKEKVRRIAQLNLDYFVDDLEDVFTDPDFPEIKKVRFSTSIASNYSGLQCGSWSEIGDVILGPVDDDEYAVIVGSFFTEKIKSCDQMIGNGNSEVRLVESYAGKRYVLKRYTDLLSDSRPRLWTEVSACRLLEDLQRVPKVVAFDMHLNMALFEWIEGESPREVNDHDIDEALGFVSSLRVLSKNISGFTSEASEACFSGQELISQIDRKLMALCSCENTGLQMFLNEIFVPLWAEVRDWSEEKWPADNLDKRLQQSQRTLSPSDFGFHNSLKQSDGTLQFLDLEYFGWDDPVKLLADFLWHPGMTLCESHATRWLRGGFEIFHEDIGLQCRFRAAWPVFGLRWVMIILNEFHSVGWERRVHANRALESKRVQKLEEQIEKAIKICRIVRDRYKESSVFKN